MPLQTSACRIQLVLQNPAHPEAKVATAALRTRSLVPVAELVSPDVSFLRPTLTTNAEVTAQLNPFAKSIFVKTDEVFLFW